VITKAIQEHSVY
jgi:hypothetical protein